jgi:hypothetical protein
MLLRLVDRKSSCAKCTIDSCWMAHPTGGGRETKMKGEGEGVREGAAHAYRAHVYPRHAGARIVCAANGDPVRPSCGPARPAASRSSSVARSARHAALDLLWREWVEDRTHSRSLQPLRAWKEQDVQFAGKQILVFISAEYWNEQNGWVHVSDRSGFLNPFPLLPYASLAWLVGHATRRILKSDMRKWSRILNDQKESHHYTFVRHVLSPFGIEVMLSFLSLYVIQSDCLLCMYIGSGLHSHNFSD